MTRSYIQRCDISNVRGLKIRLEQLKTYHLLMRRDLGQERKNTCFSTPHLFSTLDVMIPQTFDYTNFSSITLGTYACLRLSLIKCDFFNKN